MKAAAAVTVLAVVAGLAFAQTTRPAGPAPHRRAGKPTEGDLLAAESLRHAAVEMTCASSSTPARAGRLVVLCRFADRLAPSEPRTARLLADVYFAQARPEDEAGALEDYLEAFPADHALRLRWAAARLQGIQSAGDRAAFLQSLADRKDLPGAFRAEAAAMLARIRQRQGRSADALAAARRAVELDPYGPSGLAVWVDLEGPSDAAGQADLLLRRLRGDPRSAGDAWQVGLQLGALGLCEQALPFFQHAWPGADPARMPVAVASQEQLLVHYGNALLDVARHDEAIKLLVPAVQRFARNPDLAALLLEAYQAAGSKPEAEQLVKDMAKAYREREIAGEATAGLSAEIAWFHLVTMPRPVMALIHAQRAAETDPNNVVYQRILGAAELASGNDAQQKRGLERLKKLLGKDPYASVFLAERFAAAGDEQGCKQAILAAAALSRSGPASRRLAALAKQHKVTLPPPPDRQAVAKLVAGFDPGYLEVVPSPEKLLAVALEPERATLTCGEAVEITATLKNIAAIDVPVGEGGLFQPNLAFQVAAANADGEQVASVRNVPMAIWPAGRYLSAGQSLTCKVRLDVADLAAALAHRPLEDLSLTVTGTLAPAADGRSTLPSVTVPSVRITRAGLLGAFDRARPEAWDYAYRLALGRIVGDLRRGDLARRMRAARQAASLLAYARDIEGRRARPARQLAGSIDELVLLSMTRAFLQDPSPVVRQEMIASLAPVSLDEIAISLLAPAVEDPDPVVRCRLVELLAAAGTEGHKTIVDVLAGDKDELVAAMARLFQPR